MKQGTIDRRRVGDQWKIHRSKSKNGDLVKH